MNPPWWTSGKAESRSQVFWRKKCVGDLRKRWMASVCEHVRTHVRGRSYVRMPVALAKRRIQQQKYVRTHGLRTGQQERRGNFGSGIGAQLWVSAAPSSQETYRLGRRAAAEPSAACAVAVEMRETERQSEIRARSACVSGG